MKARYASWREKGGLAEHILAGKVRSASLANHDMKDDI